MMRLVAVRRVCVRDVPVRVDVAEARERRRRRGGRAELLVERQLAEPFVQDDAETRPFLASPLRYYSYTHYQQIVRAGAVRIAKSAGEMIDLVNAYLVDPSRDASGRRRVVTEQCEFTDGRSAERLAGLIVRELTGRSVPSLSDRPQAVAGNLR